MIRQSDFQIVRWKFLCHFKNKREKLLPLLMLSSTPLYSISVIVFHFSRHPGLKASSKKFVQEDTVSERKEGVRPNKLSTKEWLLYNKILFLPLYVCNFFLQYWMHAVFWTKFCSNRDVVQMLSGKVSGVLLLALMVYVKSLWILWSSKTFPGIWNCSSDNTKDVLIGSMENSQEEKKKTSGWVFVVEGYVYRVIINGVT